MTRHVSSCCPRRHTSSTRRRNPDDLYQDVQLQTWATGSSRKYWIVHGAPTNDELRIFSDSSHLDAIHKRERAHIAACDREAMQETGVKGLELTSPWMKRTDWGRVYEGTQRHLLFAIPVGIIPKRHALLVFGQRLQGVKDALVAFFVRDFLGKYQRGFLGERMGRDSGLRGGSTFPSVVMFG
ncbi:hypothetical protein V494_00012 [Pseudogymnoascus sp. VKM F-4513 (FW-928)]|nr:hypothetical protein V494_00012 [Pseudogymnoascus sp. VKM F-4513 (FW-928)]